MRQSHLFTKTRREAPSDETSKNAQLLIRGGFINKEMAGVYDYLPLGFLVLKKIENIIREEMNKIGGQEIFMSTLQRKEVWERTNRWSDEQVDNWFKTKLKDLSELGLAFTHEEPISNMLEQFVSSYKDLPFSAYQFQNKFRNETRAKSGIMRTREFIMKDLYSFDTSKVTHQIFYDKVTEAYKTIFKRAGIGDLTYFTRASGGSFSAFSHEFQTLCDSGEDTIYVSPESDIAINQEIIDEKESFEDMSVSRDSFKPMKSVEVGNIFTLGTKFSEHLLYKDEKGETHPVFMGSYGIGPGRLMGTIVEVLSDEKGIVWPKEVAPFSVHLVRLGIDSKVASFADEVYEKLQNAGVTVLYDDRDLRAGEKFADADLLGMPVRLVVSEKTIAEHKVELKHRTKDESKLVSVDEVFKLMSQ